MTKAEQSYVVIVGGENGGLLTDCEYIAIPGDYTWTRCANLPQPIRGGRLITDPETGDLLLLGGNSNSIGDLSTIYRLSDINGDWKLQDKELTTTRRGFSAMYVPDGILNCNKSNTKHDEL